ncbi:MAG TPA: sigma-70 family RNA polymerase sigma factor [Bacteroidia bacterium]|nr:sigma-70 family RNA polymerase sigma factor [Bacteroidia bacterium]
MSVETPTYLLIREKTARSVKILYERYGRKLYSYAVAKWNVDEDDAWELVYKTLYRIKETAPGYEFESEQKFGAFVFTVFINYLRNFFRDRKDKTPETVSLKDSHHAEAELPEETPPSPVMQLLRKELEKLDDWERMLLLMRNEDVPYAEIAKLTGKPADQLKVYYMRLKKKLAETLHEKIKLIQEENHENAG